ncbi:hypothetical protein [Streptomyces sp. NPDC048428]|uniref:hypothetical protein n=1 Tax=Streptomyces sp. NPDC048428 TaxID=3154503 RepID=UPI00343A9621
MIDEAADDGREEFRPLVELSAEERRQVITLPASIAKLTAVKHFVLYGSNLVRVPPEIGAMTSLEELTPYTSYRLHWFPYEIIRNLRRKVARPIRIGREALRCLLARRGVTSEIASAGRERIFQAARYVRLSLD